VPDNVPEAVPENNPIMQNTLSELDKVQAALPMVKGLEASESFAADPYDRKIVGNEYKSDFTIAGGKTPPAKFTTDSPNSTESPIMGTNKIPVVKASNGSSAPENRKDGPPGKNVKGKRNY